MKIKLSLFFSCLFYFVIQTNVCDAQNIPDLGAVIDMSDPELNKNEEEINDINELPTNDIENLPELESVNLPEVESVDISEVENTSLPEVENVDIVEVENANIPEVENTNTLENKNTNPSKTDDTKKQKTDTSTLSNNEKSLEQNNTTSSNNKTDNNVKKLADLDKTSSQNNSGNKNIQNTVSSQPKSNITSKKVNNSLTQNTTDAYETPKKKKNNRIFTSLMFSEENIRDIFKALPASTLGIPDQYIGANLNTNTTSSIANDNANNNSTTFFIYLNSIMYISKDAWSIWVNNNKITNLTNNNNDINVIEISPLYVLLGWKITNLQWQSISVNNTIKENQYKIYNDYVELFVRLSPNQTYLPNKNQIIEGMPIIDTSNQENQDNIQNDTGLNEQTEDLFF